MGALLSDEKIFHKNQLQQFSEFLNQSDFICGHNILAHDLTYLQLHAGNPGWGIDKAIDTLLLSPLLFPKTPYHHLLKDDKLQSDEKNNPLNDAKKAKNLFFDELTAFQKLDEEFKTILYQLLKDQQGFANFFKYAGYNSITDKKDLPLLIHRHFEKRFCSNSDLHQFIQFSPVALAYTLALLNCNARFSISPRQRTSQP